MAGCLLTAFARRILHIPILRYVDDFFAGEREESVQVAMDVFARCDLSFVYLFDTSLLFVLVCRLVRVCLGPTSVSARKLAHGNPLTILGVDLCIKHDGVVFWPAEQKVANWIMRIQASMSDLSMSSGEASKLSGALQWASQASFRRVGRAMLRPLINHIHSRLPVFDTSSELMLALRWWSEVLCLKIRYVPLV